MKKPIRFFDEKKTWSLMKDKILGWYLKPYITKVKQFNRRVVIVDGFAGCGAYKDGAEGSPLIICRVLEERVANTNAQAVGIFIENDADCFAELDKNLKPYEQKRLAKAVFGNFKDIATKVIEIASGSPMFFYVDPFGIKGLEFDHLEQIFERVQISSTEVLVNFNFKVLLREAKAYPELATKVMGGDYYQDILKDKSLNDDEQESKIIQLYKDHYSKFFRYVGSCPVMYKDDAKAKYHLIFATSNFDGLALMSSRMGDVYREFYADGRLFELLPSVNIRDIGLLENEILDILRTLGITDRLNIKKALIPRHFMKYRESDYNGVVGELLKNRRIHSETGRIRINDTVPLSLTAFGAPERSIKK